jgi:4-hydroxy-tetrahydrodipicolinate synthase
MSRLSGIVCPLLTSFGPDLEPAEDLYLAHAAQCLAEGVHYLSPFGTTGEATSVSPRERRHLLERLVASGTARADQLMPGTGLCSVEETADLTRHAAQLGCTAAMVLPPFFYSGVSDEGLFRAYASLIERLGAECPQIILYNIPQNTGVPVSPALSARLNIAFPEIVTAYKDSSGDWANTQAVITAAPGISVFPASETLLERALPLGAGGCISATVNSNAAAIRTYYDALLSGDQSSAAALAPRISAHRAAAQKAGLVGGLKAMKAAQTGDARWRNVRPPHVEAAAGAEAELLATLG